MLEEKGRQMLMKDNLIDLNYKNDKDLHLQFLNQLNTDIVRLQNFLQKSYTTPFTWY